MALLQYIPHQKSKTTRYSVFKFKGEKFMAVTTVTKRAGHSVPYDARRSQRDCGGEQGVCAPDDSARDRRGDGGGRGVVREPRGDQRRGDPGSRREAAARARLLRHSRAATSPIASATRSAVLRKSTSWRAIATSSSPMPSTPISSATMRTSTRTRHGHHAETRRGGGEALRRQLRPR